MQVTQRFFKTFKTEADVKYEFTGWYGGDSRGLYDSNEVYWSSQKDPDGYYRYDPKPRHYSTAYELFKREYESEQEQEASLDKWNALSNEQKKKYYEECGKDKSRFESEAEDYYKLYP